MPSKKPTRTKPKKTKKNTDRKLKDSELEEVAGGATTDPLIELESRKRPGRVKSLHQTP